MLIIAEKIEYDYSPGDDTSGKAVSGISFQLAEGDCLGIIGGPGAGKSTLALNLAGILQPTGGRLVVNGIEAAGDRSSRRRLTGKVGLVPQWPERQLFARTVAEDVAAGLDRKKEDEKSLLEKVNNALLAVGLDPSTFRDRPVVALSGAEARKAAIAGVIVLDRDLMIFDEPTAGLDPDSRREILGLIMKLKSEKRTVLVISHRLSDLMPVADRIMVLENGKCLYFGTVEEALSGSGSPSGLQLEWPPLIDLMLRLKKRHPGIRVLVRSPEEACSEILRRVPGLGFGI